MNTTTLRGIFPEPKPAYSRNFVRENIKQLKEMQNYVQESKISSKSQEIKDVRLNKFKNVAPKVYSNISTRRRFSKEGMGRRPASYDQIPKTVKPPHFAFKHRHREEKIIHRGIQTERPEDINKLYESGTLKYPSPSILAQVCKSEPKKGQSNVSPQNLIKGMQKLDLEEKQNNYIKQNIKSLKTNRQKLEEPPNPMLAPSTYQKGALPRYIKGGAKKESKEEATIKPFQIEGDEPLSGLVLLPDEERKEYLRVARENYASLIKELNSMPMSNDTLKKRKRKMEIEDELKRLDEVIKIFQKPKVFVKADA